MITLQFSTTRHITSRVISGFTWSWASHVDFVLPDGKLLGALANHGGVKIHDQLETSRIERFIVDAPDTVLEFAKTQVGKPYDWAGIFGLTFRRNWEEDDKWFCSELVAWSFKQAGYPLLSENSFRITPRDLLISPLLKPI